MRDSAKRIALTIGDPNGIGPEIAVKAAVALAGKLPRVVLVGDAAGDPAFDQVSAALGSLQTFLPRDQAGSGYVKLATAAG